MAALGALLLLVAARLGGTLGLQDGVLPRLLLRLVGARHDGEGGLGLESLVVSLAEGLGVDHLHGQEEAVPGVRVARRRGDDHRVAHLGSQARARLGGRLETDHRSALGAPHPGVAVATRRGDEAIADGSLDDEVPGDDLGDRAGDALVAPLAGEVQGDHRLAAGDEERRLTAALLDRLLLRRRLGGEVGEHDALERLRPGAVVSESPLADATVLPDLERVEQVPGDLDHRVHLRDHELGLLGRPPGYPAVHRDLRHAPVAHVGEEGLAGFDHVSAHILLVRRLGHDEEGPARDDVELQRGELGHDYLAFPPISCGALWF